MPTALLQSTFFSWKSRFLLALARLLNVCFRIVCSDEMKRRRDFYAEHPVDGKNLIFKNLVKNVVSLIYTELGPGHTSGSLVMQCLKNELN